MYQREPGCLSGLLKLTFLTWIFDAMQKRFGFGKGASCTGCSCGMILLILFILFACSIIFNTNWTQIGF
jgi:hypothetical protein